MPGLSDRSSNCRRPRSLEANRSAKMPDTSRIEIACDLAMGRLNANEEMVTVRKEYYDTIHRLCYLYDDFNDREIHVNHALQMAAGAWQDS